MILIRDVITRWNTLTEVIGRALQLREPLSHLVTLEQHNKGSRGVRLNRFKLSKQKWELLGQLHPLLDRFLVATKKISKSKTPLLHEVIPVFDVLTRALDDYVDDATKFPIVRAAARRGRSMMNKYYSLTDDSIVYRIAMCTCSNYFFFSLCLIDIDILSLVLHPRYKTVYFKQARWPQEWISTAEELLREQWTKNYQPAVVPKPATVKRDELRKNNYFAEIDDFGKTPMVSDDPITEWLASPPMSNINDPIAWWTVMKASGHPLAMMALDFLSIPGTFSSLIYIKVIHGLF
jgi:hypothetical protein